MSHLNLDISATTIRNLLAFDPERSSENEAYASRISALPDSSIEAAIAESLTEEFWKIRSQVLDVAISRLKEQV